MSKLYNSFIVIYTLSLYTSLIQGVRTNKPTLHVVIPVSSSKNLTQIIIEHPQDTEPSSSHHVIDMSQYYSQQQNPFEASSSLSRKPFWEKCMLICAKNFSQCYWGKDKRD